MPAEQEHKEDAPPQPKKKLPVKLIGIIAGLAVVQGAGFFVVFKMMGSGPEPAHGEQNPVIAEEPPAPESKASSEIVLLHSFKVPNDKTGALRIYDLDLSVVVPADQKEHAETLVTERGGEIADRVARILRGATTNMLTEDDLRVLRGQLEEGLKDIFPEEHLIQRVLIPKLVPIRVE